MQVRFLPGLQKQSECGSESEQTRSVFFFALALLRTLNRLLQLKKNSTVMFDFEKLDVYKKAKIFNAGIRGFVKNTPLDNTTKDQLRNFISWIL